MKRIFWCLCLLIALRSLGRSEPGQDLADAVKPLAEGVPQVAVVRLRALLEGKLPDEERRLANERLGEALVAAGDFEQALNVLSDAKLRELPESHFFLAQAYAGLLRWTEALPLYQLCAANQVSPFHAEALFGVAESFRALGKSDEALQALDQLKRDERWDRRADLRSVELRLTRGDTGGATRLLNSIAPTSAAEKSERRFLRGQIEATLNHQEKAIDLWAWLLKNPEGATHPVLLATLIAIAEAHLRLGTPSAGDDFLESYIERRPFDFELPAIFAKLDQLYAAEKKPSRHELARWSRDAAEPRRSLALWYLARAELRLGRRDLARQTFAQLHGAYAPLPVIAEAFLEYAQLELSDKQFEEADAILKTAGALHPVPAMADRISLLVGKNQYAAKRFDAAAKTFHEFAKADSPYAQGALFNASLAWLQAGDAKQAAATSEELNQHSGDEGARGDLLLEQGLMAAGRGESQAAEILHKFMQEFPKHARISEAWVALAEVAFQAAPPRLDEARQDLARARENQPTAIASERADYLMIWIEEAGASPNEEKVIALANEFLQKYEASSLVAEVRLKLAETSYRRQDFAGARTQFEILAQKDATSAIAEKAQFFAAQCARQSMDATSIEHALVLFDAVVKRNGEMKWAARNEEAVIERKLGKPEAAITLYDEVLKGDAQSSEKREALCGKGDIFYEMGAKDRENYRRAIALYEQLATASDPSPHWRNQALFKKGICLEKLDLPAEALATFYQVVEDQTRPERRREFFWYYKAGFNAARLLEEDSKWQPAAAIYEKLSFAGGGRSEEAKARLNRLRLEHFLWEI